MCITATVIPADRSPARLFFTEYFGSHFNTGIRFNKNCIKLKLSQNFLTLLASEKNNNNNDQIQDAIVNYLIVNNSKMIASNSLVALVPDIHFVLLSLHASAPIGSPNKGANVCILYFVDIFKSHRDIKQNQKENENENKCFTHFSL